MSINFQPLNKHDVNFSNVLDLYREAFPEIRRVPQWLLRYKMRKGKAGFSVIYDHDTWLGFIYTTEYKDIIYVQFMAITESLRSSGYGSKVIDSIKDMYCGKRIVLNIEELNEQAENYPQRLKRKAFYEKNDFNSSGYIVKEPAERVEVLIFGGNISKEEIEEMYKSLMGFPFGLLIKPEVFKI
ncbi:GNAT family N-acetyltransferase [Thalassotalea nanhaiensis]|uniref:GNAT family N-acetyltransferase n=1 Tax=Thalassotalea nanhaiensis TaxID=3065648 RepID=A0ABY9TEW4_9GAMM|nr:GNAT family N-acetyltransferase [Colwelliaceae bacterium SQ345]